LPPAVVAIDIDTAVIDRWKNITAEINAINSDGISFLKNLTSELNNESTVIYCDPPYPMNSRKSNKKIYKYEMADKDHADLLSILLQLRSRVLISTIPNELYANYLTNWNVKEFYNKTRKGMQKEYVYYNFQNCSCELQDYRYLGNNHREREIIKRKLNRWIKRISKLNNYERNYLFKLLNVDMKKNISF
jgi:hypothetical protein